MYKNGKTSNGTQRFVCRKCKRTAQKDYSYRAYSTEINDRLITLIKEGVGIRGILRILGISSTTTLKRIVKIARSIPQPQITVGRTYEMDELYTYVGSKLNMVCIAFALERDSRNVIDFSIGRRNKGTLRKVVDALVLSNAKEIRTDKLSLYINLVPKEIHHVKQRGINRIERMNLNLRTHIKRLNRRTIAYSKSLLVLSAILRIYFWS